MVVAILVVKETRGLTIIVNKGKTISTIDGLGTMIAVILAVEEMDGSRLLESLVDEP